MIFLTETKCKIRFIYVGFNCKRQKWGKKCLEIMTIKGGGRGVWRLMEKNILNFHFDYLHPSLTHRSSGSNLVVAKYWTLQSNIFHFCPRIMVTPASHKGAISTISNHRRLLQSTWVESRTLQNGNCTLQLLFREGDKKKPRFLGLTPK